MLPLRQIREISMQRINGTEMRDDKDLLAAEEPLEIRVEGRSVAVVMRTPGNDHELAAGFLASEGLVRAAGDIREISYQEHCQFPGRVKALANDTDAQQSAGNVIHVRLKNPAALDLAKLTRNVFTSSSCGICSKASIEAVRQNFPRIEDDCKVEPRVLMDLPRTLGLAQQTFKQTGGLHACALFDLNGKLIVLHEDVGRHNALDKVVGWALMRNLLPLRGHVLLLSGRTSFEMMQKALAAGIPIVAAISAPSSLAADFARDCGQTLVGFLRGERMNIYAGAARISNQPMAAPARL